MSTVLLSAEPQRTEKEPQHIQMAKICTGGLCVLKEKKVFMQTMMVSIINTGTVLAIFGIEKPKKIIMDYTCLITVLLCSFLNLTP